MNRLIFAILLLGSFVLIGCGSSSPSTEKAGGQSTTPSAETDASNSGQDESRPEGTTGSSESDPDSRPSREAYIRGKVITPAGSTGVASAVIEVREGGENGQILASTVADSAGSFRIQDSPGCMQCWFTARDDKRGMEGSTEINVPDEATFVPEDIYIKLGREGLEMTPFDSTEVDPGRAGGENRTGGR